MKPMSNNNPLVSIVLPVYNGAKYLRNAIDSCLNQTYLNIELIIVDDCSTDKTPEIIKSYHDPRVRYIRNENNLRLPASLNVGFRLCQGDYLTWTSHDNQYLPTAIEEMLEFLLQRPDVDFVYADMEVVNLKTGEKTIRPCTHWTFYFENAIGACYLYTRKLYATIGQYDPRFELVEDYDYWLRIEKKFSIRRLPRVLYLYGDHPQSLTSLKYYSIDVLAYILRYQHGYLSFEGLGDAIGRYLLKFPPFKKGSWQMWKPVIQKVAGLGPLQITAWKAAAAWAYKKSASAVNLLLRKIKGLFKAPGGFEEILSGLSQGNPHKTQVLCVIPFMTLEGAQKVVQEIVLGLTPQGHDFHLFCFKKDENEGLAKFAGSFINAVTVPAVYDIDIYAGYLTQIIGRLGIKMLLISNEHMAYKALGPIKQIFPELKVIDILHLEHVGGAHKHISLLGGPYVDRRVCISRHLFNYMKYEYGNWEVPLYMASRLRVIHNGTSLTEISSNKLIAGKFRQQFGIPDGSKIISFAARMAPAQNPFIFFDIARCLIARNPQERLRFVMAGEGPLLESLEARIREYGLEDRFILPGAMANVSDLLRDSFVFVMVSSHEGIPLTIQEAMLMKIPVVSTKVGAIHEIISDKQNGFLIPHDEQVVEKAVSIIEYLIQQPQAYDRIAQCTREAVYPEFTSETMCRRYGELFDEVLNEQRKRMPFADEARKDLIYAG